jgi:hypothetical protein
MKRARCIVRTTVVEEQVPPVAVPRASRGEETFIHTADAIMMQGVTRSWPVLQICRFIPCFTLLMPIQVITAATSSSTRSFVSSAAYVDVMVCLCGTCWGQINDCSDLNCKFELSRYPYAGFGWDSCDKGGWYKILSEKVDAMRVCCSTISSRISLLRSESSATI